MNERLTPTADPVKPQKAAVRTQPNVQGRDREFLPAALEILETPPPPLPVIMLLTICAFFAVALVWSFIGRLDVHAVAQGKIERAGSAKVVQPLEPGKIAAVHAAAGDAVKAGDLLVEFDPSEAQADADAQRDARDAARAESARRRAAVDIARAAQHVAQASGGQASSLLGAVAGDAPARVGWDASTPHVFQVREGAVLTADLFQLSDALGALDKQIAQKEASLERLRMSISFQDALIQTLTDRVSTRQQAIDLNVGTKINLYDAKEQLQRSQSSLASDQGQLIETDAAVKELVGEKAKTISQFIAENENKLVDADRRADEARDALAKAQAKLERMKLYAPIDGVVQRIAITTIGQVVTTGQDLVVITPSSGTLQVEALVANLDIGFIKPGQEAVIKVDAFPFTRFGVLHGKVERIAAEAIEEQSAKRNLADATASGSPTLSPPSSAPGAPESFVFPVTVSLDASTMKVEGIDTPLSPGMTVSVEVKTDRRRVIDYILSPLAKAASEAMRER